MEPRLELGDDLYDDDFCDIELELKDTASLPVDSKKSKPTNFANSFDSLFNSAFKANPKAHMAIEQLRAKGAAATLHMPVKKTAHEVDAKSPQPPQIQVVKVHLFLGTPNQMTLNCRKNIASNIEVLFEIALYLGGARDKVPEDFISVLIPCDVPKNMTKDEISYLTSTFAIKLLKGLPEFKSTEMENRKLAFVEELRKTVTMRLFNQNIRELDKNLKAALIRYYTPSTQGASNMFAKDQSQAQKPSSENGMMDDSVQFRSK